MQVGSRCVCSEGVVRRQEALGAVPCGRGTECSKDEKGQDGRQGGGGAGAQAALCSLGGLRAWTEGWGGVQPLPRASLIVGVLVAPASQMKKLKL